MFCNIKTEKDTLRDVYDISHTSYGLSDRALHQLPQPVHVWEALLKEGGKHPGVLLDVFLRGVRNIIVPQFQTGKWDKNG